MSKCLTCNAEAVDDRARCAKCLRYAAEYARQYNKRRREASLCINCGTPVVDKAYCPKCSEQRAAYARKYYAERRSRGLCTECGKPVSDQYMCDDCLSKYRAYRRNGIRSKLYQSIKERDGWKCRICGKETGLCIHHIDGQGEKDSLNNRQTSNDEPSNLITLCRGCHASLTKFSRCCVNRSLVIQLINGIRLELPQDPH